MRTFKKTPLFIAVLTALSSGQVNADTVLDKSKKENTVIKMTNGVTQIDIATPNHDGVSMNYFNKFNVEHKGTIINNSNVDYNSVLAGRIKGNKNLASREADVAVMNVTGQEKTRLTSQLEAASSKNLHVYIANENGILVDGARFTNIQKMTLTTGVVDESLTTRVKQGEVVISEKGLKGVKNLNIFAESLKNSGKIAADEKITAILGHNHIDKDGRIIFVPSKFYVKSSRLGKIYADQIDIQATSGLDLQIDELLAKNKIHLEADTKVINKGNIMAKNKIKIKAKSFDNLGQVQFDDHSYDLKWLTRDGDIVDLDFITNVWNQTHQKQLTSQDTWLLMTGTLLNQWTYDQSTYDRDGSIVKNFKQFLQQINLSDKNAVLTKEGIDLISEKQRNSAFVNKGDIYATELNDKRILEAIAISKQKAKQAVISADTVVVDIDDVLTNQDAVIDGKKSLKISAKKIVNKNSLSKEIKLQDGYENISWEVMPIYIEKRSFWRPRKVKKVVADATYDIHYERGLVDKESARSTKIAAVNTSAIKGKDISIHTQELDLQDDINTGTAIQGENLNINAGKMNLKGQKIVADKLTLQAQEANLSGAVIEAKQQKINVDKLQLDLIKNKETVLKTDKEHLTREVGASSAILAEEALDLQAKTLNLNASIIKSGNKLRINADEINNLSSSLVKDYQSSYEISKTFRNIKHNEKTEVNAPSFIYAKDLEINADHLNSKGSNVVGTERIKINSQVTKVDVATVTNYLDKKIGIDNGILGENYKKVKTEEQKNIRSSIQSAGEIQAKIEKELALIGSQIKGSKVTIDAKDINISSAQAQQHNSTDSREILAGDDLTGTVELNDSNIKINMDLAKVEHTESHSVTNTGSLIEGQEVSLNANDNVSLQGSDIQANKVDINGANIQINHSQDSLSTRQDSVEQKLHSEVGIKGDALTSHTTITTTHKHTNSETVTANSANIQAQDIHISGDNVTITGSNLQGNTHIQAKDKVLIQNADNHSKFEQDAETFILGMGGEVKSSVIHLITDAKQLVDQREQLLGQLLNPIGAYHKAQEIKQKLEQNYNEIKSLVNNVKQNNIDPAALGIAVSTNGSIQLNKQYIHALESKTHASHITGDDVQISAGQDIDLQNANINADNLTMDANNIHIIAAQNKKDAYEVDANVGLTAQANIVTETVNAEVNAGIAHKQNHKTEQVASQINAKHLDINANQSLSVENSTINGESGQVSAEHIERISKADKETNFGIAVGGKMDPETQNGKLNASSKIEHHQQVNSEATINVENIAGNINTQTEANVNLSGQGNVTTDGKQTTANAGLSTDIHKQSEHTDGNYTLSVNGQLNVDDQGQITDSNLSSNVNGDVAIKTESNLPMKDSHLNFEANSHINNDGVIGGNATADISTVVSGEHSLNNGKLEGDLHIGAHTALGGDSQQGVNQFAGDVHSQGHLTITGEHNFNDGKLDGALTINADSQASAGLGQQINANIHGTSDGQLNVEGKKDLQNGSFNGALNIHSHTEGAADSQAGLTQLEGQLNSQGTATLAGEKPLTDGKLDGALTINADSQASAGLGQQINANIHGTSDGQLNVEGKKDLQNGSFNGTLNIHSHTEGAADSQAGLTQLEGQLNSQGTATLAGEKPLTDGKLDGTLTINADSQASAGLGQQINANIHGTSDGQLNVEGKKDLQNGSFNGALNIHSHTEGAADSQAGLTQLEGQLNSQGNATLAGEKPLTDGKLDGALTINADSQASAGLGQQINANIHGTSDGQLNVEGKKDLQNGSFNGALNIHSHTEGAADSQAGLTQLEGQLNSQGNATLAGEKPLTDGKLDGALTINADSQASAGLGQQINANIHGTSDGQLNVEGKKDLQNGSFNGALNIHSHTEGAADSQAGLTQLEGQLNSQGTATLAGEKPLTDGKLDGALTINADSQASAGLGQQINANIHGTSDGQLNLEGKKDLQNGSFNGALNIHSHTEGTADSQAGLTQLEGQLNSQGTATLAGEKPLTDGKLDGALTINADSQASAGLGQQINANIHGTSDGQLNLEGKKDLQNGSFNGALNIHSHTEGAADSQAGLTQLEGQLNSQGTATLAGEKPLTDGKLDGALTINADSQASAGLGQQINANIHGTSDGQLNVEGKKEKFFRIKQFFRRLFHIEK